MLASKRIIVSSAACAVAVLLAQGRLAAQTPVDRNLAKEIFNTMVQVHGVEPERRLVHAKGIVCKGTFTPTKEAAALSKAAHFQAGAAVPVTIRFSDGAPDSMIPDNSPNAGPRGIAIRFAAAGAGETDIVAMSHNGFVVGTLDEFLELQKSVVATDPSKPHPWPVEQFLGAHPLAMKFVTENRISPASFATESFFSNDAFVFVNKEGSKQAGRYKILPAAGTTHLTEAEAGGKSPGFLTDDLKSRLSKEPVKYRLVVQLPAAGDSTKDPSQVWPEDRKTIEVGTISLTSVVPDNAAAERSLAFDPASLIDGIELSDDPFPAMRSAVYAMSAKRRHAD